MNGLFLGWETQRTTSTAAGKFNLLILHILFMEEILHHLIGSVSHYLQGFVDSRWLFRISSINISTVSTG